MNYLNSDNTVNYKLLLKLVFITRIIFLQYVIESSNSDNLV